MARGREKAAVQTAPVEGPWELPEGWRWATLNQIAEINPKRDFSGLSDDTELTFVPMAAVAEESGAIDISQRRQTGEIRKGYTRFQSGDVLFAKITPCMENGKAAVVPDIPHGLGAGSTEFHVLKPGEVLPQYLFHWITQRWFRQEAEFNMTGTAGQKRVPTAWLTNATIPVPPLETQRRIVARIDELFSELDDGETALARAREDLEVYRKALLKAAVTGELTADWRAANPPKETGEQLLQRILAERRARWEADPKNKGKRYKEPAAPDASGLSELPEGWAWVRIQDIAEVVTGGTPPTSKKSYYDGEIPFFTPSDLDAGYGVSSTRRSISESGLQVVRPIPARSIMVTCIGATIGKTGFNFVAGATNQQINSVVPLYSDISEYIYLFFAGIGKRAVVDRASSTTLPILNKSAFSAIPIPLPPLAEARKIAHMTLKRLAEVAALMEESSLSNKTSHLRQSILAAAFEGELVQ